MSKATTSKNFIAESLPMVTRYRPSFDMSRATTGPHVDGCFNTWTRDRKSKRPEAQPNSHKEMKLGSTNQTSWENRLEITEWDYALRGDAWHCSNIHEHAKMRENCEIILMDETRNPTLDSKLVVTFKSNMESYLHWALKKCRLGSRRLLKMCVTSLETRFSGQALLTFMWAVMLHELDAFELLLPKFHMPILRGGHQEVCPGAARNVSDLLPTRPL